MDQITPPKVTTLAELEATVATGPSETPTKRNITTIQTHATPSTPLVAAPPPLSLTTTDATILTPSNARHMTRQTAASFNGATARSSTDELIDSLNDTAHPTNSPQGPSQSKQKGKETDAAIPATLPVAYLKPAPAPTSTRKKAEETAAGLKRLDDNISAVAHRVDEVYREVSDDISSLRAHMVGLAADITAPQRAPDDRLDDVVRSTNQITRAVADLRADNRAINSTIQAHQDHVHNLSGSIEELKSQVTTLVNIAGRLERQGTNSEPNAGVVAQASYPFTFRAPPPAPSFPGPAFAPAPSFPGPALAPNLPFAPPPQTRGPRNVESVEGIVVFGPMTWGKDITGQAKAILGMLPSMQRMSQQGLRARRSHHSSHHISIHFPTYSDAAFFINTWQKEAPQGYEGVSAVLGQGN